MTNDLRGPLVAKCAVLSCCEQHSERAELVKMSHGSLRIVTCAVTASVCPGSRVKSQPLEQAEEFRV